MPDGHVTEISPFRINSATFPSPIPFETGVPSRIIVELDNRI